MAYISWGTNFRGFRGGSRFPYPPNGNFSIWILKVNIMTASIESSECVIFVQSTKIGPHENKAIYSMTKKSNCIIVKKKIIIDMYFSTFSF